MNWRDAVTVDMFVREMERLMKSGANHPTAIECARREAEYLHRLGGLVRSATAAIKQPDPPDDEPCAPI